MTFDGVVQDALAWAAALNNFDNMDAADYRTGYRALLRLFNDFVDVHDYERAYVGALAVYGWMPRIPQEPLRREIWDKSLDALSSLRGTQDWWSAQVLLEQQLDLMRLINGSVVGTSKFLHFLNPNVFPIWDSRIARCFGYDWEYQYDQPEAYIPYALGIAHTVSGGVTFSDAFDRFCGDVGDLRKLELLLFLFGKSKPRRGGAANRK